MSVIINENQFEKLMRHCASLINQLISLIVTALPACAAVKSPNHRMHVIVNLPNQRFQ